MLSTSDYKWWRPSFAEYNKVQEAVVPFCDKDVNIVVSSATATGKTVIAECAFAYHVATGGNCLYICPFRAIADEKTRIWEKSSLSSRGFSIWSGDNSERNETGLVVGTLEAVDIAIKSCKKDEWVKSLKCVVLDEAHIIGDKSRGSVAENVIIDITELNPSCRIIFLSATMGNARELASWIKSLNGKVTKCISSNWRPFDVEYRIYAVDSFSEKIEKTLELVSQNSFVKTLVFVHSKKTGKLLVEKLREVGIRAVFHNASVKASIRAKMEAEFREPYSGLNVMVSTSTLGAGVNV